MGSTKNFLSILQSVLSQICLIAIAVLSFQTTCQAEDISETFRQSKRIVFLGDSVTYAGDFIAYLDLWRNVEYGIEQQVVMNLGLPSETVSGLSEEGHAGGQFPRPVLRERLDRVLEVTKPDLVIACYGMNCGIYLPLDESRFEKYQAGIEELKKAVESKSAKCILVTPPSYDEKRSENPNHYNQVLDRYSEWLLAQRDRGWMVVDLHFPMVAELEARRNDDPNFTFQPDAVHPNEQGQWFVAQMWLNQLTPKAAQWRSPADMQLALGVSDRARELTFRRMQLVRDAYLSAAGHLRPGMAPGQSLEMVAREVATINEQLRKEMEPKK